MKSQSLGRCGVQGRTLDEMARNISFRKAKSDRERLFIALHQSEQMSQEKVAAGGDHANKQQRVIAKFECERLLEGTHLLCVEDRRSGLKQLLNDAGKTNENSVAERKLIAREV